MPVINITQKDINRQKPADEGWHLLELTSVSEGTSKDKQSVNFVFEFEVTGDNDPSKGRYVYQLVNSKAAGMSLIPMGCAILNIKLDEFNPQEIDTDKWIGKKVWGEIVDRVYEGKIQKNVTNWAPENSRAPF